jgi:phosphate:Na+ symporter
MLTGLLTVIRTNDAQLARQIRRMDDDVDGLYTAIKLYLTQIGREALDERDARRWAEIISFTINMEHVGDIIERILDDLVDKKIAQRLEFSDAGMAEICDMHTRVLTNLRLGMNVFLNGDLKSAQRLLATKVELRKLQQEYADTHLRRLAGQTVQSIETSSLHLDIINDFKRINSHIVSVAYPILEQAGALSPTRLREDFVEGADPKQKHA